MNRYLKAAGALLGTTIRQPATLARVMKTVPPIASAWAFSRRLRGTPPEAPEPAASPGNPLWDYFKDYREGPGIWKWIHYFDAYHRHFAKFIGRKVDVLEIGIYSGGSLGMWRAYFGEQSHIYGVDIQDACRVYENDHTSIFIGDQGDRSFWRRFKDQVDGIDVLIDDGGHTPEQQQTTLEEMLPHLRPGGVYFCEDICGPFNRFAAFATGLVHELNSMVPAGESIHDVAVSPFQSVVHSIHFYPYIVVIEKHATAPPKLLAPRHGTEWQPFLGGRHNTI
jgi:hypothetical protein